MAYREVKEVNYEGTKWYITLQVKDNDQVNIYVGISGPYDASKDHIYPHYHVFAPDMRQKGGWLKLSLDSGGGDRNHIDFKGLPPYVVNQIMGVLSSPDWKDATSQESSGEAQNLMREIERFANEVSKAERHSRNDWGKAVDFSKKVNDLSKQRKLSKTDAQKVRKSLDAIFEKLKRLQEEAKKYHEECDANYRNLKSQIDKIIFNAKHVDPDVKKVFDDLKTMQEKLKETKALRKKERDELWDKLNTGFEAIGSKQDDHYHSIKKEVENALGAAKVSGTDTRAAFDTLKQTQAKLKQLSIKREQKDALWKQIQQGFDILEKKREDQKWERVRNKQSLESSVQNCVFQAKSSSDFRPTREELIRVSQQVRNTDLLREDRESFKSRLDDAFDTLKRRQEEAGKRKKSEWESRSYEKISRKREAISKIEDSIRRDEERLSELYRKYDDVRPGQKESEIKSRINTWMNETRSRISEKRAKTESIAREIRELESQLR